MCMMELITGDIPYKNNPIGTIYKNVTSGNLPSNIVIIKNLKAKEIIFSCLHKDPNLRPTVDELVNNLFFTDICKTDISDSMCLKYNGGIKHSIYHDFI
ncbi:unnamed protein product [marine sediment metagenome]|uniref:Protein kinase domain-containing protein n=1 Tax=marine sediment metagenome TaxID=412755 RepID=X1HZU7_9ZZZZ